MARVELWPLSVTEVCGGTFNFIDYLQEADFSLPQNFPELGREQMAQLPLDGGYPEVQGMSGRGKSIWFKSYMECLKHMTWASAEVNIYHYRDKQKNEVDLVLERAGGGLIGIEVKASASVNEGDFKGLVKFAGFVGERLETGIIL